MQATQIARNHQKIGHKPASVRIFVSLYEIGILASFASRIGWLDKFSNSFSKRPWHNCLRGAAKGLYTADHFILHSTCTHLVDDGAHHWGRSKKNQSLQIHRFVDGFWILDHGLQLWFLKHSLSCSALFFFWNRDVTNFCSWRKTNVCGKLTKIVKKCQDK